MVFPDIETKLTCPLDNDARNVEVELAEDIAPEVARFIQRLLALKVEVPKKEVLPTFDPSKPPVPPIVDPLKDQEG